MSCSVTKVSPAAASLGLMNLLIYHRHFAHTYAPQGIPDTAYEYILHIYIPYMYALQCPQRAGCARVARILPNGVNLFSRCKQMWSAEFIGISCNSCWCCKVLGLWPKPDEPDAKMLSFETDWLLPPFEKADGKMKSSD